MKRLGVTANCEKSDAASALARVSATASALGLELVVCDETARSLRGARRTVPARFARQIDALLALGGDGTMLRAVRLLAGADVPLMGVNLGSLGFLTSVAEENLEQAMRALAAGLCRQSLRSAALARLRRGRKTLGAYRALNDVVIGWGGSSRVVTLHLLIGGEDVGRFVCDGLIVSTPTGSTGHMLSAGGPMVHPEAPVFAINPICPHTLAHRPLVVPDSSRIEIVVARSTKRQLFVIDGQDHHEIMEGDRVEITRARTPVRLLHLPGYSYFALLRQKLHLRGSNV